MPSFEAQIIDRLKSWPGLSIVGERFEAEYLPQDANYPSIVFAAFAPNDSDDYAHGGYQGVSQAFMEFGVFAKTYTQAKALHDEIFKALETWDMAGTVIDYIMREGWEDASEPDLIRIVTSRYRIKYRGLEV